MIGDPIRRLAEARARVDSYEAWLHAGCPRGQIPLIPSDRDYQLVKQAPTGEVQLTLEDLRTLESRA